MRHRIAYARVFTLLIMAALGWPSTLVAPPVVLASASSPARTVPVFSPLDTPGTFRAATSAASTPITTVVVAKPAGVTTNDVLLAAVTVRGAPTITAPTGWTLIRSDASGTTITQATYRHVAGASEPSTYTWTLGSAVSSAVGTIDAYSGVSTTTPVDVSGGQTNTSSTSVTAPSVTTTVANDMVVGFFGTANDATFTPATGTTERSDTLAHGTADISAESADVIKATAGATGTKVATASKAAINVGQLVALKPSGTIAFRAAATTSSVATTSLAINKPTGTVADDVLLASISGQTLPTISAPVGWSLVRSDTDGAEITQSIFVRTAGGSEPSSYTFTFNGAVASAVGGIIGYSGIDPLSPIDAAAGQGNASSTSVTAPSITTTVADVMVVGFFATADNDTFSPPTGMTERFDVLATGKSKVAGEGAEVSQALAGATGTKVATASGAAVNVGALVGLRSAGSTLNLGQQSQFSMESWDLGLGDTLGVNAGTRNAIVSHPVVSLPIRGSSTSLGLAYNAFDTSNVGMGPGWRLNPQRRLHTNADSTVTFTDGDGARYAFTSPVTVGTVTTYTRPAALFATLVKDTSISANEFVLTYRDQSRDKFDILDHDAILVRTEDRFGNGVTLAYTANTTNLITITDTAGSRTIDLAWDTTTNPAHLTSITDWAYISGGVVQTTNTGSRRQYRLFYDTAGNLAGWSDPLNTAGSCPTGGSHLTCLAYTAGLLAAISKTQTVETFSSGTLGTSGRTITTDIAYASGNLVSTVTDAEQHAQGSPLRTTFTAESSTKIRVDRPTTTTSYGLVAAGDAYARVQSVWRKLDGTTSLERRTTWDSTYPTLPASVTENYGALLSTPAVTTSYTYVASSLGLLLKSVEPLTGSTNRWTEFVYNANNDVTLRTVSLDGSGTDKTVTKSCYTTQSMACATSETGLTLVRQILNWVSAGNQNADTNVATDDVYDAYGQQTSQTRHNRSGSGAGVVQDDRVTGFTYDSLGDQTSTIENYSNGTVSPNSDDTIPNATTGARTDLTTAMTYDTAGNQVSSADPRRAIGLASTTYARDAFGRTLTGSWGTADTGGSWSSTDSTFDVGSGIGTITQSTNAAKSGYLTSVSAQDQEAVLKVRVDHLAVGSDHLVWIYLRRQDSNNYYQARLSFNVSGSITAYFNRTGAGTTTVIGAATTSVPHTTADWYWLRARISGTTSVNGKVKLWKDGTTEPATWAVDATDAAPPAALQGSGHTGIRFQLGGSYSGTYPVFASFDEFTLSSIGGGGQALAADDYVRRTTFDPLNEQISDTTPTTPGVTITQHTATTTFDEYGLARSAADYNLLVTATEYDRAGRASRTFEDPDPPGSASVTTITTVDADGKILTDQDRAQAADSTLGSAKTVFDGLGRVDTVTSGYGSNPDVATDTKTTYDGLDRTASVESGYGSPSSQKTIYAYDLGGHTISTDDGFACRTATFDYRDLSLTATDALVGGTCASGTDTRTVTDSFDGLGRQYRIEVIAGADTGDRPTDLVFDSAGHQLSAAVKKNGTTSTATFTVNLLDQVMTEARADGSTAKTTSDAAGNAADRCYWAPSVTVGTCFEVGHSGWTNPPTSSTSTTSDAQDMRIGLVDSATNQTTTYDPNHLYLVSAIYTPTIADLSHEQQSLYSYDSRHRLTGIAQQLCVVSTGHSCSSTTATGSNTYAYDENDNRTQVSENNGATSSDRRYCYDALDQLIYRNTGAACSSGANDEAWTYDDAGNRLSAKTGGVTTNFAYTAEGLLCDARTAAASCTGGNITSDSAGRILSYNGWTYGYDADGRLVSACKSATCAAGSDAVTFAYDGEGHRTSIVETPAAGTSIATTTFRYQGDAPVEEVTTVGAPTNTTITRTFTIDDSGRIIRMTIPSGTSAGTYQVTWNGHGDTLALWKVNADGTLTLANSYTYDTWGKPTTTLAGSFADLGFRYLYVGGSGVEWDNGLSVGLIYMHARHYVPAFGRFLEPDPAAPGGNLYGYGEANPVTLTDPAGTGPEIATCLVFAEAPPAAGACVGIDVAVTLLIGIGGFLGVAVLTPPAPEATKTITENAATGAYFEYLFLYFLLKVLSNWHWETHVYFWTPYGARYLDICGYYGWAPKQQPRFCLELKFGGSRYTYQQRWKDVYIMWRHRFPIFVIRGR
jgi:RHS repeat-associated protein